MHTCTLLRIDHVYLNFDIMTLLSTNFASSVSVQLVHQDGSEGKVFATEA